MSDDKEFSRDKWPTEIIEATSAKLHAEATYFDVQSARERLIAENLALDITNTKLELEKAQKRRREELAANDENRVYDFTSEVTASTCEQAMSTIGRWVRLGNERITLRLSSPGGSVIAGLALFDYLVGYVRHTKKIELTTVTIGWAASMAGILLQAGDKRVMGETAHILIHEVSSGAIGKLSEMEDETKFARRLNNKLFGIIAERSKKSGAPKPMTRKAIEQHAKRKDWWVDAEEAKRYGFCDAVGYGE